MDEMQTLLEKIEGHLGCNWQAEYPGIEKLSGAPLLEALRTIAAELKGD